jgi:hypothetical protein
MEIFPVVHIRDVDQSLEQSQVAFGAGADGVFLIDHGGDLQRQVAAYNKVRQAFPNEFIGLNFLSVPDAREAYELVAILEEDGIIEKAPDGLWVDDSRGAHRGSTDELQALKALKTRRDHSELLEGIRFYGGTAFKYTRDYTSDPQGAAEQAAANGPFIDVVTTSGEGTGKSANVEKVAAMRQALGSGLLALASGVDETNIESYKPYVDQVLVSSSVETEMYSGIFDEDRLKRLIDLAHAE